MYQTTESYKNALKSNPIINRVEGSVTLSNGTVLNVSDANILPGSLSINNRATADNQFSLGSVYVGQLNVSLMVSGSSYSFNNAEVKLSYYLTLADDTEEEIPLGVYYVSKATRSKKTIDLVCYDNMTLLDKDILQSTSGTAWDILSFISEECEIELGQTEEEIEELPNADVVFVADNNDVSTWRDAVCGIAQMVGGFATIGRDGKLYLKHFHSTVDATLTAGDRIRSSISDYTTYFAGVKASFKANENYYPYVELTTRTSGLILDLGTNSLVRGEDDYKHEVLANVAAVVDAIIYTPVQVDIVNDPSIELGDMLTLSNVNGTQNGVNLIVTAINWNYRQKHSIKSEGIDPHTVKSSTDKAIQVVATQSESNQLLYYSYTNSKVVSVENAWQKILDIDVVTTKVTDLMVFVSINLEATQTTDTEKTYSVIIDDETKEVTVTKKLPVTCELKYFWNDNEIQFYPVETYKDGKHILTLAYFLNNVEGNIAATFEMQMKSTDGTIRIEKGGAIASIIGQGLVAKENQWDGTLTIEEEFEPITIAGDISIATFTDAVSVTKRTPTSRGFTEQFTPISLNGSISIAGFSASISVETDTEGE